MADVFNSFEHWERKETAEDTKKKNEPKKKIEGRVNKIESR